MSNKISHEKRLTGMGVKYHYRKGIFVRVPKNMAINLNTASVEDLKDIQDLEEDKARQLVNYREKNGPFGNWDDVKEIPGFSDNLVETLKKGGAEIA